MESQQINGGMVSKRLGKWLGGAAITISACLYFMYFALAAGYEQSWPKNASGPGENMFEVFAFLHVVIGCCFAIVLFLHVFERRFVTLFLQLPFLALSSLMLFRIYEVSLNKWPTWIENYSRVLLNFSHLDFLLAVIVASLWILLAHNAYRLIKAKV
jgi:hypothetical protein